MNMQQMLSGSGKTMSNMDLQQLKKILGPPPQGPMPYIPNISMSDNEPRMEDRSPNNQMFSIESAINNLMTEYDMVVQNQDFQRAQMIADQIDQLQQQKIGIQSQMGDQQMSQAMMGESGRTPSNQDTDQISRILESISI